MGEDASPESGGLSRGTLKGVWGQKKSSPHRIETVFVSEFIEGQKKGLHMKLERI